VEIIRHKDCSSNPYPGSAGILAGWAPRKLAGKDAGAPRFTELYEWIAEVYAEISKNNAL